MFKKILTGIDGVSRIKYLLRSHFFYALLPTILFYFLIFKSQWIPFHDTFHMISVMYSIFNEFVVNSVFPLWFPYYNFGVNTNWDIVRIGPSFAFLLPFAKLFHSGNFLSFYFIGLFLNELILLFGSYMLSRLIFRNAITSVFVSIAATGSTLWYSQVYFNFNLYYLLPLSLYYIIKGCQQSSLWRIMCSWVVLLISFYGAGLYSPVILCMTSSLFLAISIYVYRFNLKTAFKNIGKMEIFVFILLAVLVSVYVLLLTYGVDHAVWATGRGSDNTVNMDVFLSYPSQSKVYDKFFELFMGTTFDIDINIYSGILVLLFALFGIIWAPQRAQMPFLLTCGLLVLFSLGEKSFIAPLIYYVPLVKYYRHIGYVLPIVKILLIFLAGFGFDSLVGNLFNCNLDSKKLRSISVLNICLLSAFGITLLIFAVFSFVYGIDNKLIFNIHYTSPLVNKANFYSRIAFTGLLYFAGIVIFIVLSIHKKKVAPLVIYALLALHITDVYSYRYLMFHKNMVTIKESRDLFKFRKEPFVSQRIKNYSDSPVYIKFSEIPMKGVIYNCVEQFLGIDMCNGKYRPSFWLQGTNKLFLAEMGIPASNSTVDKRSLPSDDPKFNKIIGCSLPKIQVFNKLLLSKNVPNLAQIIHELEYKGDLLLTSEDAYSAYENKAKKGGLLLSDIDKEYLPEPADKNWVHNLSESSRVDVDMDFIEFTANKMSVQITAPTKKGGYWLYYADAWHPFWRAYVNKAEVPVLQANLAFKAVEIPAGKAIVEFRYSSSVMIILIIITWVLLAGFMIWILTRIWKILFSK